MKTLLLSTIISIFGFGICSAQSTDENLNMAAKINTRSERVTQNLTQQLSLNPSQQEQVKVVYQESLQQIQQLFQSNDENKTVVNDQINTLIQQRQVRLLARWHQHK